MDTTNVINKSKKIFTDTQLRVLSKGFKFIPTTKSTDIANIITNTEYSLKKAPDVIKQAAIAQISKFINKWKPPKHNNMSKEERKAMKELKDAKDIVIVQADKSGKIAVMDKEEYALKIEEKLRDQSFFEDVKNPTKTIKVNIMELTKRLYKLSRINLNTKYGFLSIENIPTIRGQPKLHKQNHPMRIITCSRNTITSPLSKFIFSYIKQLRTTIKTPITNTSSFVNDITEKQIYKDEKFISLDIEDFLVQLQLMYTPLFSRTEQEKNPIGVTNERVISSSENNRIDVI